MHTLGVQQLPSEQREVGGVEGPLLVHGEPCGGHDATHPSHQVHLEGVHACVATHHDTGDIGGGVHHLVVRVLPAEPASPLHGGGGEELCHGGDEGVRDVCVARDQGSTKLKLSNIQGHFV